MKKSLYGEQDYAFGQAMLTLRTKTGLTQIALAQLLGVSRKSVGRWEAGSSYPSVLHLKALLTFVVKQGIFPPGCEREEIGAFWQATRQKVLLDEAWMQALIDSQVPQKRWEEQGDRRSIAALEQWTSRDSKRYSNEMLPTASAFYGREQELATLTQWVIQDHCSAVVLWGQHGIGKSSLAQMLISQLSSQFEVIIWRSLRDAPDCQCVVDECIQALAPHLSRPVAPTLERSIRCLLELLSTRRVLLVLDHLDALLQQGTHAGLMREGYEGYDQLLHHVGEGQHRSCLIVTSREKMSELACLEGSRKPVRTLHLTALHMHACEQLLQEKELAGSREEMQLLVERYNGHPLALNIVAQNIVELFESEIGAFLELGEVLFGPLRDLLARQFERLSKIEQQVVLWLAIMREPLTIDQLLVLIVEPCSGNQLLEAMDNLYRRSLIERGQHSTSFTLQLLMREYAIQHLIGELVNAVTQGCLTYLIQYGLQVAISGKYILPIQERVIVAPLLTQLRNAYPQREALETQLLLLLDRMRARAEYAQGYGPTNLLILLRQQRGHLHNTDLSHLSILKPLLQEVEIQRMALVETA